MHEPEQETTFETLNGRPEIGPNRSRARMEGGRVLLFNGDRTKIERIYMFLIVGHELDLAYTDRAALFDISDCFSGPSEHKWMEVQYPMAMRVSQENVAEYFYEQHSSSEQLQLNFLRVPKIEQTIDGYYLSLRAKVLDLQPDPIGRLRRRRHLLPAGNRLSAIRNSVINNDNSHNHRD